jgi:hypothetical protein
MLDTVNSYNEISFVLQQRLYDRHNDSLFATLDPHADVYMYSFHLGISVASVT